MAQPTHRNGTNGDEPLGIESVLWAAADKLRGSMDATEYKHVVLGLVFLKYVSDRFEAHRAFLEQAVADPDSDLYIKFEEQRPVVLEDRDEYTAYNVFWIPAEGRWEKIRDAAKTPKIGEVIDEAMDSIEAENPQLRGILPKNFARPSIDKRRLGELIDLVSGVGFGDGDDHRDILGRVYEYFLGKFAASEGKGGGEFYTPRPVVRLLVEMLEPYSGRVYDPCCGSGGMFVQSAEFIEAHGGNPDRLSVYGQELNATTWRLGKMNLAVHGIESNLGDSWGDTFHDDKHPDLRADFVLANPPFNISDWGGERLRDDPRWQYGIPPAGNSNFAWVQHILYHLAPDGTAGVVLANGSMTSQTSGEGDIRKNLIEGDVVDCMVALPGQLFYTTQIPVCLWFFAKNKANGKHRDRRGEILFIDARHMGEMVDRTHRTLTEEDIVTIAGVYHAWRDGAGYEDQPGFCRAVTVEEIRKHSHVLTPGRYVEVAEQEEDDEPFEDKMQRITGELAELFAKSHHLETKIRAQLEKIGYGI